MNISDNQAQVICDAIHRHASDNIPVSKKSSVSVEFEFKDGFKYLYTIDTFSFFGYRVIWHSYLHSFKSNDGFFVDLTKKQAKMILSAMKETYLSDDLIKQNRELHIYKAFNKGEL